MAGAGWNWRRTNGGCQLGPDSGLRLLNGVFWAWLPTCFRHVAYPRPAMGQAPFDFCSSRTRVAPESSSPAQPRPSSHPFAICFLGLWPFACQIVRVCTLHQLPVSPVRALKVYKTHVSRRSVFLCHHHTRSFYSSVFTSLPVEHLQDEVSLLRSLRPSARARHCCRDQTGCSRLHLRVGVLHPVMA